MPNVLMLVPMKPDLHPALVRITEELTGAMIAECPEVHSLVIDRRPIDGTTQSHRERQQPMADLRNQLIDDYLSDEHTHVLWFDADVVHAPVDLPRQLLSMGPNVIAAPAALLDGDPCLRWYDIAGFIENGQRPAFYPPWFDQESQVVRLDSVGMVYLVPADVYRRGVRHYPVHPFTEHYSVCRDSGLDVLCNTGVMVYNADVTQYGERYH